MCNTKNIKELEIKGYVKNILHIEDRPRKGMSSKISTKLYIICLDSHLKERGQLCLDRFSDIFENVKCHSAMTPSDFQQTGNDDISWLVHDKISKKNRDNHCDMNEWTQIGCYLSHVEAWKYCVKHKKGMYVAEDDVYIKNMGKFQKTLEQRPECDFASILNAHGSRGKSLVKNYAKLDAYVQGTQMYYITPKCAKVLLKYAFPVICHVDMYISTVLPQRMAEGSIFVNIEGNLNWKSNSQSTLSHGLNIKPYLTEFRVKIIITIMFLLFVMNLFFMIRIYQSKIPIMKMRSK